MCNDVTRARGIEYLVHHGLLAQSFSNFFLFIYLLLFGWFLFPDLFSINWNEFRAQVRSGVGPTRPSQSRRYLFVYLFLGFFSFIFGSGRLDSAD